MARLLIILALFLVFPASAQFNRCGAGFCNVSSLSSCGPGTWLPSTPGASVTKTWLDAADAATITSSVGVVSQWNSKTTVFGVTPQGATGPTTGVDTQNGLNVLTFSGSNNLGVGGVTFPDNSPGLTILSVAKFDSAATDGWVAFATDSGATDFSWSWGHSGISTFSIRGDQSDVPAQASFTDSSNSYQLVSGIATTALRQIWLSGTSQATNTNTESAKPAGRLYVGSDNNPVTFITGKIAEIIIFEGTDTDTRQKAEGYLAWKWGLQGSLDPSQPYKCNGPNAPTTCSNTLDFSESCNSQYATVI